MIGMYCLKLLVMVLAIILICNIKNGAMNISILNIDKNRAGLAGYFMMI